MRLPPTSMPHGNIIKNGVSWGAWVVQSVERQASAQVVMSQFMSSSPALGSLLSVQGPPQISGPLSPFLSAPPPLAL